MRNFRITKPTVLATILLACNMLLSCKNGKEAEKSARDSVAVTVMTVGQTSEGGPSTSYTGTIAEDRSTVASFMASGTITRLSVEEGQRVAKGQHLGSIDATQVQSAHESSKALLAQAQDAYNRVKKLYESQAVPEIKWVEVQTKLQQAQNSEQIARKALADCQLYAPASGVVSEKMAEVGQNVMAGTPVVRIASVGELKAVVSIPEAEIGGISTGQKADVSVGALGDKEFRAVVTEKNVIANPITRTYEVKLKIQSPSAQLMPGMVASIRFDKSKTSGSEGTERLTIPANVVQIDEENHTFVWTVKGNKAQKATIQCGEYVGNDIVVESGLKAGDKVIAEGQHKVCSTSYVVVK